MLNTLRLSSITVKRGRQLSTGGTEEKKVLRDYSFCEIVAFYPSPLHFATLNFLHSTIMKLLIAGRWLIHRIF